MIKAVTDPENIAAIMASVKISMPGMNKIQQQAKKAKKKNAKV